MDHDGDMIPAHMSSILTLLDISDFEQAKLLFKQWPVQESTVESISALVNYIRSPEPKSAEAVSTCQWMLTDISARIPDPDEIFLEFLSHMDEVDNDAVLLGMVKCAEVCLSRMTTTKTRALSWCLMTLRETLNQIDPSSMDRIYKLHTEVEAFYTGCIKSLKDDSEQIEEVKERKKSLAVFLLSLLVQTSLPIKFSGQMVRSLGEVLPHLGYPLMYLDEKAEWKKNMADTYHFLDEVPLSVSYQVLYYLVIHKGIGSEFFPLVFSPTFLFVRLGALSSQLLVNEEAKHQRQGLDLLKDVLSRVDPGSISYRALSSNHYQNLLLGLTNVMVYSSELETRKEGSATLKKFIFSFDERGGYLVLYHCLRCIENQGVKGYLITFIKDFVAKYLKTGGYFLRKLPELLSRICIFPKKYDKCLYDCHDMVISLLNLIRYLTIIDPKPGNITGLWSLESQIRSKFLLPVSSALEASSFSLQERMEDTMRQVDLSNAVVQVGDETLPAPEVKDEVNGIQMRLTQLDFVQHVYDIVAEAFS